MADDVMDEEVLTKSDKKEAKRAAKAEKKAMKRKSKKSPVFIILIILIMLGSLLAMVYLDLFGIRSNFLNDTLRNVPILNNMLPPAENNLSREELELEITRLTSELENNAKNIAELEARLITSQGEVARLKPFEEEKLQFMEEKTEFDTLVANEDRDGFIKFYEAIYPDTADEVYRTLKGQQISDELLKDYIARFENMKAGNASAILTEMIYTDMDIVILILENLSNTQSADIIAGFTPVDAATVVKRMAPTN